MGKQSEGNVTFEEFLSFDWLNCKMRRGNVPQEYRAANIYLKQSIIL
jgi:hypothetical protein